MALDLESSTTGMGVDLGDVSAQQNIFAGDGSIMGWVNAESFGEGSNGRIMDKSSSLSGTNGWSFLFTTPDDIAFLKGFTTGNGAWETTGSGSVVVDTWYHIAATYNSDSTANNPTLYINGVVQTITEITTPSGTSESDIGQNLIIGNTTSFDRSWDGILSDMKLFDRIVSSAEVQTHFAAQGHDGIVDGLVGRYTMNEKPTGQEAGLNTFLVDITTAAISSTFLSISVPTHTNGDLLVMIMCSGGDSSGTPANVTTPAGWTLEGTVDLPSTVSTPSLWVFSRSASSEPASYSFITNQTTSLTGFMASYDGNEVATSADAIASNTGTTASPIAPTISPSDNALVLRICAADNSPLPTPTSDFFPTDTVGRGTLVQTGVGNGCSLGFADSLAPSGATGTATFTLGASDQWGCFSVAFLGGDGNNDISTVKDLSKTKNDGQPVAFPVYATDELSFRKNV